MGDLTMVRLRWALLSIAATTGCGASTAPVEGGRTAVTLSEDGRTVRLAGPITAGTASAARRLINQGAQRLIIDSPGGEIVPGILLGRAVRAKRVVVIVEGACLSACAHLVFAPAFRHEVRNLSIVGFHGTATARSELLDASNRRDLASTYDKIASLEQSFYAAARLDKELLSVPLRQVLPFCYLENDKVSVGSEFRSTIATRLTFYVPSLKMLQSFGMAPIEGYWPQNSSDLQESIAHSATARRFTFRLASADQSHVTTHMPAITACKMNAD